MNNVNHISSSTEDLKLLFKAELELVNFLKKSESNQNSSAIIENYLKSVDFDEKIETEDYVKHPINAFHLLQRTSQWIPKLKVGKYQKVFIFALSSKKITVPLLFLLRDISLVHYYEDGAKIKYILI